jgi:hypothetical protein
LGADVSLVHVFSRRSRTPVAAQREASVFLAGFSALEVTGNGFTSSDRARIVLRGGYVSGSPDSNGAVIHQKGSFNVERWVVENSGHSAVFVSDLESAVQVYDAIFAVDAAHAIAAHSSEELVFQRIRITGGSTIAVFLDDANFNGRDLYIAGANKGVVGETSVAELETTKIEAVKNRALELEERSVLRLKDFIALGPGRHHGFGAYLAATSVMAERFSIDGWLTGMYTLGDVLSLHQGVFTNNGTALKVIISDSKLRSGLSEVDFRDNDLAIAKE